LIEVAIMAGTTGAHDIGGLSVNAAIGVASGHKKYQLWELQTHCLVTLLSKCGLLTVDEVCLFAEIHRARKSSTALSSIYFWRELC